MCRYYCCIFAILFLTSRLCVCVCISLTWKKVSRKKELVAHAAAVVSAETAAVLALSQTHTHTQLTHALAYFDNYAAFLFLFLGSFSLFLFDVFDAFPINFSHIFSAVVHFVCLSMFHFGF